MKKSQLVYVKKIIEKLELAAMNYQYLTPESATLMLRMRIKFAKKRGKNKPYMCMQPEHKTKEYHLERIEKNGRIVVDCEYNPPSKLFNKEIKKGLLKRIREGSVTKRRTYLVKVTT